MLKQSIAPMQSPISLWVELESAHTALHSAKRSSMEVPPQTLVAFWPAPSQEVLLLTMQFRAAAVSWRASCRLLLPFGLTQIAWIAD